jgi:O-antigen ligase
MEQSLFKKATSNMAFAGAILICIGFVFGDRTPAPQSIGVGLIFAHPFFNLKIKSALKNLYTNKYALGLVAYYLLILLSAFNTVSWQIYREIILMQVPFIVMPFGLYSSKVLSAKQKDIVLATLVSAVLLAGIASFINYLIHWEAIQESITHSKPIPIITKVNHIYYSVLLAFSAGVLQWWLFVRKILNKNYKILAWIGFVIAVALLFSISARTGLLCFYAQIGASILWLIFKQKKILHGIAIGVAMILLGYATVKLVPSLASRMGNTKKDLNKYNSGEDVNNYSIATRIKALIVGAHVFKNNPIFGVGPSEVREKMDQEYSVEQSSLTYENRVKPHNQFLYVMVSMGIVGGLILCYIMFMPFVTKDVFRNYLLLIFLTIFIFAFQAEYMLERQVGTTFFCLFYVMLSQMTGAKEQLQERHELETQTATVV